MQCKEMDSIEKGIVQLISQLSIKWLVMGAGASKSCSRYNAVKTFTYSQVLILMIVDNLLHYKCYDIFLVSYMKTYLPLHAIHH